MVLRWVLVLVVIGVFTPVANPAAFADGTSCAQALKIFGMEPKDYARRYREGGFLEDNGRLWFAAPDQGMALKMANHLKVTPGYPRLVDRLSGWTGFDVTETPLISPMAKRYANFASAYDGVRCYSCVYLRQGFAKGAINTFTGEMALWAKSPLVREVPLSNPQAGDVIAVSREPREMVPLDHVATFETPRVMVQKNSPRAEDPFEIITVDKFMREYPAERPPEGGYFFPHRRLYRQMETVDAYVERNRAKLPADLLNRLGEIAAIESEMEPLVIKKRGGPEDPDKFTEQDWGRYADALAGGRTRVMARADAIENEATEKLRALGGGEDLTKVAVYLKHQSDPRIFLWQHVRVRAMSLQTYPDPFD